MEQVYEVELLGGFRFMRDGRSIELPPQAASLLAYLITNRDRPQTRDLLAGRFWPDQPEAVARKRLSRTLWRINSAARDAGCGTIVASSGSTLRFSGKVTTDVDRLQGAVNLFQSRLNGGNRLAPTEDVVARLEEVIGSFAGELMSGYYDEWIDHERSQVNDLHRIGLEALIKHHRGSGSYELALRYARQLVAQDPLDEEARCDVMRLYVLLGKPRAAQREFVELKGVLKLELGVEPAQSTVELMRKIVADGNVGTPYRTLAPRVQTVGRAGERETLAGALNAVAAGQGGVVILEGEPGIGKSRLVEELIASAEFRAIRVLKAAPTHASVHNPFDLIAGALRAATSGIHGEHLAEVVEPVWLGQAARVLEGLSGIVNDANVDHELRREDEPERMKDALAEVVLAQGELQPTLIVLEDVHWADSESMDVLARLADRISAKPVLVCASYRRFEAQQWGQSWSSLLKLEQSSATVALKLGPLQPQEVAQLIASASGSGAVDEERVRWFCKQALGNPLYILEALKLPGAIGIDSDAGDSDNPANFIPSSVQHSLQLRWENASQACQEVLRGLAVMARAATSDELVAATSLPKRVVLSALNDAISLGFVQETTEGWLAFVHEQPRRAIYDMMSVREQRLWHGNVFDVLIDAGSDLASLAHHARWAGRWPEAYQLYLDLAAASIKLHGYTTAVEHFEQAESLAELADVPLRDRITDLFEYEAALDLLGRPAEQRALLKRIDDPELPVELQVEVARRQAWLLANTGKATEAATLAEANLERAQQLGLPTDRLLSVVGFALFTAGDREGAIAALQRATEVATDVEARLFAQTFLGRAHIERGDSSKAAKVLQEALETAEETGSARDQVEVLLNLAVAASKALDHELANEFYAAAYELSQAIGYRRGEGISLINRAMVESLTGRSGVALTYLEQARGIVESSDNTRGSAFVLLNLSEMYLWLLGNTSEALTNAELAANHFRQIGDFHHEAMAYCTLTSVDILEGRHRRALKRLKQLLKDVEAFPEPVKEFEVRRVFHHLELAKGDYDAAIEQLDRALELSEQTDVRLTVPHIHANKSHALLRLGRDEEAVALARRAAAKNVVGCERSHLSALRCFEVFEALGHHDCADEQIRFAYERLSQSTIGLTTAQRNDVWSKLKDHKQIRREYERRYPREITVKLPTFGNSGGRRLSDEDFVTVQWLVSAPQDWTSKSGQHRRHVRLRRLSTQALEQGAICRISDLASVLDVSQSTVKRDIAELRAQGEQIVTMRSDK